MSHAVGPIVDFARSPHAALRPVPVSAVQLTDAFWEPRRVLNREVTIPSQLRHCETTNRIRNFQVASGKIEGAFEGIYFNDSDVYKWAEAAAWSLATYPDPELDAQLDAVIAEIAAAQQPDGYLNTYFMFAREKDRFANLKDLHEIYCAGHLIQAAVAHHRATGKTNFLTVAVRLADHLDATFGPGKRVGACGHEEAEMALVELYRVTGERRYLTLAEGMIEARGNQPPVLGGSAYHQDHAPFRAMNEMVGHAVRMLYLCCGAADVVAETGDDAYREALDALWRNFTQRRMYLTGGAGARWEGEAFGADYELPNDRAYAETCAAIGNVMWQWRMLNITGEARYADLMERTLYNAVLPGISLDGTQYFYQNPLSDRGKHRRQEWFGCACCPPNIARLLAQLPGYFASVSGADVYLHLYAQGTLNLTLPSGGAVRLSVETDYPWSGEIEIKVEEVTGEVGMLYLRIPGWAQEYSLAFDGSVFPDYELEGVSAGDYFSVSLRGKSGEVFTLTMPMPVERVASHPFVQANLGREALLRGPLVYCLEQADQDEDVHHLHLCADSIFAPVERPELLNGVVVLTGNGLAVERSAWEETLYAPAPDYEDAWETTLTAIPYYAWANREAGAMQVWIPAMDAWLDDEDENGDFAE